MIEIRTMEIAGLVSALEALRLPFGKECRSKAEFKCCLGANDTNSLMDCTTHIEFDPRDLHLMHVLAKRGDEHAKVVRGIVIYAEINAPLAFWSEADTYRVGTDRLSSESTMHTIGDGGLTIRDFSVPPIIYDILGEKEYKEKIIQPLRVDEPEKLMCVEREYMGRKYEIWNNGDIYSLPYEIDEVMPNGVKRHRRFEKSKIKTGKTRNNQGYYQVRLGGRDGKTFVLHRILAEAFVPNPNGYNVVNHKDGNKGNCSITNLEWCTSSYNNKHAYATGLKEKSLQERYQNYKDNLKWSDEDVATWCKMREEGKTLQEIADISGASTNLICQYTNGHRFEGVSEYSMWFNFAKYYEDIINQINDLSAMYKESGDYDYVLRIKEILPTSFKQKRVQMFSYQTLRRIYIQRKNHRLPHWQVFCNWIETLPFAQELILAGLGDE